MSSFVLNPPVRPPSASASRPVGNAGVPASDALPSIGSGAYRSARRALDDAQPSDATLLGRARAGDAAAFATVYDRHAAAAYGLARRMLQSPGAAQDVVQEAFLSLWRTDSYCAEKGSLRTFLLGIVRNRAIDTLRKDRRRSAEAHSDDTVIARLTAADRTDLEVEQRDTEHLLRAALTKLPDTQHQALDLAYFGGMTHAEIALRLNEPIGTIKGRIRLGLEKLRADADVTSCG
jgi:RNA polymerase sigma-70 factor (ECF subfamily)